jgi:hypothetical protein
MNVYLKNGQQIVTKGVGAFRSFDLKVSCPQGFSSNVRAVSLHRRSTGSQGEYKDPKFAITCVAPPPPTSEDCPKGLIDFENYAATYNQPTDINGATFKVGSPQHTVRFSTGNSNLNQNLWVQRLFWDKHAKSNFRERVFLGVESDKHTWNTIKKEHQPLLGAIAISTNNQSQFPSGSKGPYAYYRVDISPPITQASGLLVDLDDNEGWYVQAKNAKGQLVATGYYHSQWTPNASGRGIQWKVDVTDKVQLRVSNMQNFKLPTKRERVMKSYPRNASPMDISFIEFFGRKDDEDIFGAAFDRFCF